MKKWIAACLSLMLALVGLVALAQPAQDIVLATVNDEPIYQKDADQLIPALLSYQYIQNAADYATAVDYLVRQKILTLKIAEMKFDEFTDEEKAAFEADAQTEWDNALAEYVNYYLSEDTEEARAKLLEQRRHLKVDPALFALVVFQIVDDGYGHAHVPAGCRDAREFADVLAHKDALDHRVGLSEEHGTDLRRRVEGDVVKIVQHAEDAIPPVVFLACCHDGKDDIVRHHTDVAVFRVKVAHHRFASALNGHGEPPVI